MPSNPESIPVDQRVSDRRTPPNSIEVMGLSEQAWRNFLAVPGWGTVTEFMVELGKVGLCITSMEQARLGGVALNKDGGH